MARIKAYLKQHDCGPKIEAFLYGYIIGCIVASISGSWAYLFFLGVSLIAGLPLGFVGFLLYLLQTDYSLRNKILNMVIPIICALIYSMADRFYLHSWATLYWVFPIYAFTITAAIWCFHDVIVETKSE